MQIVKKIGRTILILLVFFVVACRGGGTTNVGNTNTTATLITIGQLSSSNSTLISIPFTAFASSEADLETTILNIFNNGEVLSGDFDLPSHYDASVQEVSLTLTGLAAGDTLNFVFTRSGTTVASYFGRVSATEATTALSSGSVTVTLSDDGSFISGNFSSDAIGAFVSTSDSCYITSTEGYGFYAYKTFLVASVSGVTNIDLLDGDWETRTVFSGAASTTFLAEIPQTGYTLSCGYALAASAITGTCTITSVTDATLISRSGETCNIEYLKCDTVTQGGYFNSAENVFSISPSTSDQLDACYVGNDSGL